MPGLDAQRFVNYLLTIAALLLNICTSLRFLMLLALTGRPLRCPGSQKRQARAALSDADRYDGQTKNRHLRPGQDGDERECARTSKGVEWQDRKQV